MGKKKNKYSLLFCSCVFCAHRNHFALHVLFVFRSHPFSHRCHPHLTKQKPSLSPSKNVKWCLLCKCWICDLFIEVWQGVGRTFGDCRALLFSLSSVKWVISPCYALFLSFFFCSLRYFFLFAFLKEGNAGCKKKMAKVSNLASSSYLN